MKRRLLILFVLLACLAILRTENVVHADACSDCATAFTTCTSSAVNAFQTCWWSADSDYDSCIADANPPSFCMDQFNMRMDSCMATYSYATYSCQSTYMSCRQQHCGGPGYGGGAYGCNPVQGMGYSAVGVSFYASFLEPCIADGAAAFEGMYLDTSGFENCMANSGPEPDQGFCCAAQITAYIEQNCGCNLDSRNPDCLSCYVFP